MEKSPKLKKKGKKTVWVNLKRTHYPLIRKCVLEMGWKVTESETKNILFWCDNEGTSDIATHLQRYQFYNHFPGMWAIAHKVELSKNFEKMNRALPDIYNFHPKTFILPQRINELTEFMLSIPKKSKRTFIIKPDTGAQGRGIILVQDPNVLEDYDNSAVAQQYVEPFLIDGLKFDLRIYVLVTSINPLRIYIHREGMARFCTQPYHPPKSSNLDDCYAHLTNFSLNKSSATFQANKTEENPDTGSKRSMSSVFKRIKEMGIDAEAVQNRIDDVIRLTLLSIQPHLATMYHTTVAVNDGKCRCFEILGFDILLDSKAHPWLIEVNTMPSLTTGSPFDEVLKKSAVLGALKIIDLKPIFKKRCQNRLKEMSISRGPPQPICNFSPETESEIAKTTNWRQLYPLVEPINEKSAQMCEKAVEAASLGLYTETAAARRRKERLAALHRSEPKNKPLPKMTRPKVPAKNDEDEKEKDKEKEKKIPMPSMRLLELAKSKDEARSRPMSSHETPRVDLMSPGSNARTPRSVLLANEARINRILATERREKLRERVPFFMIYNEADPNRISENEERERLKNIKRQAAVATSMGIMQRLRLILKAGGARTATLNISTDHPLTRPEPKGRSINVFNPNMKELFQRMV